MEENVDPNRPSFSLHFACTEKWSHKCGKMLFLVNKKRLCKWVKNSRVSFASTCTLKDCVGWDISWLFTKMFTFFDFPLWRSVLYFFHCTGQKPKLINYGYEKSGDYSSFSYRNSLLEWSIFDFKFSTDRQCHTILKILVPSLFLWKNDVAFLGIPLLDSFSLQNIVLCFICHIKLNHFSFDKLLIHIIFWSWMYIYIIFALWELVFWNSSFSGFSQAAEWGTSQETNFHQTWIIRSTVTQPNSNTICQKLKEFYLNCHSSSWTHVIRNLRILFLILWHKERKRKTYLARETAFISKLQVTKNHCRIHIFIYVFEKRQKFINYSNIVDEWLKILLDSNSLLLTVIQQVCFCYK